MALALITFQFKYAAIVVGLFAWKEAIRADMLLIKVGTVIMMFDTWDWEKPNDWKNDCHVLDERPLPLTLMSDINWE